VLQAHLLLYFYIKKICLVLFFLSLTSVYTDTELHVFEVGSILHIKAFQVLLKPIWPTVMVYHLEFDCWPYITSSVGEF